MLCEVPQVFGVVSSWPTHFFREAEIKREEQTLQRLCCFPRLRLQTAVFRAGRHHSLPSLPTESSCAFAQRQRKNNRCPTSDRARGPARGHSPLLTRAAGQKSPRFLPVSDTKFAATKASSHAPVPTAGNGQHSALCMPLESKHVFFLLKLQDLPRYGARPSGTASGAAVPRALLPSLLHPISVFKRENQILVGLLGCSGTGAVARPCWRESGLGGRARAILAAPSPASQMTPPCMLACRCVKVCACMECVCVCVRDRGAGGNSGRETLSLLPTDQLSVTRQIMPEQGR